ncbi:MAG: hypothetical protein LUB59_05340 [Candidatus Gastranaerophilales bacterium]|nr:hypothetical protein [Candidatus Gastranaerophilales bacterium]
MNRKDFENGCFSGDWTEFENAGMPDSLNTFEENDTVEEQQTKNLFGGWSEFEEEHNLTQKQRKDLAVLLLELEDIKRDFERISGRKERLSNLMKFYNGGISAS